MAKYACFNWPYHVLLGFQKQESKVDETITTSLVTLIENLLTLQGKTWYNTILIFFVYKKNMMLSWLRDGTFLFQVSFSNSQMITTLNMFNTLQESIVMKSILRLFEEVNHFYEVRVCEWDIFTNQCFPIDSK